MAFGGAMRRVLRRFGLDVVYYRRDTHPDARRSALLVGERISLVFDVGANTGQFGKSLRRLGYKGRIISFEPLAEPYRTLRDSAARDREWMFVHAAVGAEDGEAEINVAADSATSSLLSTTAALTSAVPRARVVERQKTKIVRLDSVFGQFAAPGDCIYLKVDTQGYERFVLDGAERSLPGIVLVQLEMSLIPLYAGEALLAETLAAMERRGFRLVNLEETFADPRSGHLLQIDGTFVNTHLKHGGDS